MMDAELEFFGKPVKILDVYGKKLYIDFERLVNTKKRHCRIVYKYAGKWWFKYNNVAGICLIHKDNIAKFL